MKNSKNGFGQYAILLPKEPTKSEIFAGEELARFFQEATGSALEAVKEGSEEFARFNGNYLSIGNTFLFKQSGEVLTRENMNVDGVRVFTKDGNAVMNAFSESGKIYAVYEFLKAQFNFTVYAPDEIYVEKTDGFSLKEIDITSIPDFVGRDVHNYTLIYDPLLSVRMRSNGVRTVFPEEYGEGSVWSKSYWCHSTFMLLPPDRYAEKHPEWYTDNKLQLCIATALEDTDEGKLMYSTFMENFKAVIAAEPKATYFIVGQEDVGYTCEREKSKAMNAKYGGEKQASSGTLMVFINKVAREIKAWLKQTAPERADRVKIVIFAYQKTQQPPVAWNEAAGRYECVPEVVPEENVVVRFAPLASVYSKNFLDKEYNEPSRTSILGWSGIGAKLSVWNYDVGFGSYEFPLYNWQVLQENYKIFKKYGVEDILVQGPCDSPATPFLAMRNYVHSRLLWNTDLNVEELVKEFIGHYFKAAAKYIYQYYEYTNAYYKAMEITNGFLAYAGIWESADVSIPKYYKKDFIENCLKIFEKAKACAMEIEDSALREKVLERVRREELAPRFMMLDLYRRDFDKKECDQMIKAFVKDAEELGLKAYREGLPRTSVEKRAETWTADLNFGTPVEYL